MPLSSKRDEYNLIRKLINDRHSLFTEIQWEISEVDNKINELTQKILNNPSNEDLETGLIVNYANL